MSDLSIRRFEHGDGPEIRAVAEAAMRTTPEYHPDAPDDDLRDVSGYYLDDGGEFLVGERNGEVVATGAYKPVEGWKTEELPDLDPNAAELTRMRVDPDLHRRGYGRAIYEALEDRARQDGRPSFVLDTGADNDAARNFYEALGFDGHGVVSVEFGGHDFRLALYRKPL